jgi:Transposase DDE domain
MTHTPFFPAWSARLNPMGSRTATTARQIAAFTLCHLEACVGCWIPTDLFPKATSGSNSRDRHYTRWRTFWCMLWQALNPRASHREVVRQLQALFHLQNGPSLSPEDGAYCRAKARLPGDPFLLALRATAQAADQRAPTSLRLLQGRPIKVADGSTLLLEDTPKNRAAYPPIESGNTPTFPLLRFVALFSLRSGAIAAVAQGPWAVSELALLHRLAAELIPADILVGDRGFGSYPVIAWLKHLLGVDFVGRTTRRIDGRCRIKRLGRNDWLIGWKRGASCKSPWLSALQRAALPPQMTLRAVKGSCYQRGFRVRRVTVVTTLLDPELYPAREILQAYLRRWRLELCLDDLKTTLQMEFLHRRTPEMVHKEIYARLIAHNLLRCTMAEAARQHDVPLERLSFKGSLDALRHFTYAIATARTKAKRQDLWDLFLEILAQDQVPERPGRRQPRAVKRKKNKYPRLRGSRHRFQDRPGRHTRERYARLRKLGLM